MSGHENETPFTRQQFLRLAGFGVVGLQVNALGALTGGCASVPRDNGGESESATEPFAGIADLKGQKVAAPALHGRITVIDFWASWCAPCRQGFKYLDQLFQTYTGQGLNVLAISVDTDLDAARRFHARMRPRFPVYWDKQGKIRNQFRVQGLPTSILLNDKARVIHRYEGFDAQSHQLLVAHVRRLLQGI